MFKRNHVSVTAAVALIFTSSAVFAETTTSTATVTVQNAFSLAEVAPLNFGTLAISQTLAQGAGAAALITLPVDGSAMVPTAGTNATTPSSIRAITPGTLAEYAITGAAQFTNLTLTVVSEVGPNGATAAAGKIEGVNLATLQAPGGGVNTFTIFADNTDVLVVGGANDGDPLSVTGNNLRTDATGAVGFLLGATLEFAQAGLNPEDGDYSGTYSVTVNY